LEGKDYYSITSYTDSKKTYHLYTTAGGGEITEDYYLSDEKEEIFKSDRVGKIKQGKYIVLRKDYLDSQEIKDTHNYKILISTSDTLAVEHIESGSILEYKAIE
ncbi:hypothetical protein LJC00_01120, partial [Dysgonomonas sp. OttesenSCG-928-M03]|nr:hypothetical protein [Dysgonomonas sp. OttesenSCG-928-M03]